MTQIDIWPLAVNILVLLFSLSLHESAHAWTAERFGDSTGRRLGRVTLNPLAHIDPVGTLLFPLVGFLAGGLVFGWAKPVPINVSNLHNPRRAQLFISAAGPASNILAAIGFLIGLKVLGSLLTGGFETSLAQPLFLLCRAGLILNVILAVFNLIPIPPLDGSWVIEGLLPELFSSLFKMIRPYGFFLLLILLYTGFLQNIMRPVLNLVLEVALL